MDNTREKLIELIQSAVDGCATYWAWLIADHLIANGVTFDKDINALTKKIAELEKSNRNWRRKMQKIRQRYAKNDADKWIPVTERLPEEDGKYLVFRKHTYGTETATLRFAKDARKVDKYDFVLRWKNVWYRYDSEWGHITIDDVTHWMPLPEPPKEDRP